MAGPQGNQGNPGNVRDKAEQSGANLGAAAGRKAGEIADRAQQAGSNLAQRAQETASNVGQRASEMASHAGKHASEMASNLGEKAEGAVTSVGERMSSWGESLRQSAPHEGTLGSAASSVAGTLESGGRYLQEHDFSDMAEDVTAVVRRYPIQALLAAFGVGLFFGMTSRR